MKKWTAERLVEISGLVTADGCRIRTAPLSSLQASHDEGSEVLRNEMGIVINVSSAGRLHHVRTTRAEREQHHTTR